MVGTFPVDGTLTMDGLAATLTDHEVYGFTRLTRLAIDSAQVRNMATMAVRTADVGALSICSAGSAWAGQKVLSATVYISGAKTAVDVYRASNVSG